MKKVCLSCFLLLCSMFVLAQKIQTRKIDKFTKNEIIETTVESLYSINFMGSGWIYKFDFQIRKVNDVYVIPADILMEDIVKYTDDDGITFLLENGETIFLKTGYTGIGSKPFSKGYYFSTVFHLSNSDVEKLQTFKVTDVRISYLGGSYDRKLKKKKQELIMNMLSLF